MTPTRYYVVGDDLLYSGRAYTHGEEIELDNVTLGNQLAKDGRVSTTKPEPLPDPNAPTAAPAEVTIADFPSDQLMEEFFSRFDTEIEDADPDDLQELVSFNEQLSEKLTEAGAITPAEVTSEPVDYSKLDKDDLEKEIEHRLAALEVEGTGSKGAVTKEDLVRTLEASDAASTSPSDD